MLLTVSNVFPKANGGFGGYHTSIESLPDEILLNIFQRIESADSQKKQNFQYLSRVSKRWYILSSLSRTTLSVSGLKAAKIAKILSRFTEISVLNLTFLFDCSEEVLDAVGNYCGRLTELHVPDSYRTSEGWGLESMAKGCKSLHVLSLQGYKGPDCALLSLGGNCKELRKLRLRSALNLSDKTVMHLANNCHKLEELDLSFNAITDCSLEEIGNGMPSLRVLDLKHCKNITGKGIAAVARGCPKLEMLHLGVVEVGDEGVIALGKHSKHLEELYLDYGSGNREKISRASMAAIASGCSNLRILSLRGSKQVDDDVLHGLAKGCPSLAELDLHACDKVSDEGLHSIIKGCKKLQVLILTGTSTGTRGALTFEGGLPYLTMMRMNGELVTNDVLKSVGENCKQVSELHFANCRISDEGLAHLIRGCKHLKSLTMKSCADLNGVGFSSVCDNLGHLALPSCGITDEGLQAVMKMCPVVHQLCIPSCQKLTADGLLQAVPLNTSLKELNIAACLQISKDDLINLTKAANYALKSMRVSRPGSPEDEYTLKRQHGRWVVPNWARTGATSPRGLVQL